MALTQDNRKIAVHTPLGKDKLILLYFSGKESISDLFSFKLTMISEDHQIAFQDIIGKNVTISVKLFDQNTRFINGIVSRFSQGKGIPYDDNRLEKPVVYASYTAIVVPQFWLLTQTMNSKIFQNKTVDEIINEVLEKQVDHVEYYLQTYPVKEYCVQYQESDFSFISRLLEEEGIYYYFKHEKKNIHW